MAMAAKVEAVKATALRSVKAEALVAKVEAVNATAVESVKAVRATATAVESVGVVTATVVKTVHTHAACSRIARREAPPRGQRFVSFRM